MRLIQLRSFRPLSLLLLGSASLFHASPAQSADFVRDPEWRAGFLGSYRVLAAVEPEITEDERTALRETLNQMSTSLPAAAQHLQGAINQQSSAALNLVLGNLYFQTGELERAQQQYRQAIGKHPNFLRAYQNLGLLEVQRDQHDDAIRSLSKAIELGAKEARLYGLLAYCFLHRQDYLAAEQAYREAHLLDPDNRDWQMGLVQVLSQSGDHQATITLCRQLLDEAPDNAVLWKLIANAQVSLQQPLAAAKTLEMARVYSPGDPSSLALLGDIYFNEGLFALAQSSYAEAIAQSGDQAFEPTLRMAGLLLRSEEVEPAYDLLQKIQQHATIPANRELDVLTLQAKIQRRQGNEAEATETLRKIVNLDGTQGEALLELADYHWNHGEQAAALERLQQAQRLEAYRFDALVRHAQLLVSLKRYDEAAERLNQALQLREEPRIQRYYDQVRRAAQGV
ncbi:MAG: tetratricopeptide repeat protein [Verrucomicrobiota bacterium JB022]|nr:tetratricopeptide repeat protein [Verrucomicrobiota bacterium JB022]